MSDLALVYLSEGKFAQAEPLAREALGWEKKVQPGEWQQYNAECLVGESLAGQKKLAEGEPLLREGCQGMLARKDQIDASDLYHLKLAHDWLAQLRQSEAHPGSPAGRP